MTASNRLNSKSPDASVIRVQLSKLQPHPQNANVMSDRLLGKLERAISRNGGKYPPLIVRPSSSSPDLYEILDGHQRVTVLRRLGHLDALCLIWPCDDAMALTLLATLNRLRGRDAPELRSALIAELNGLLPKEVLSELLPDDSGAIAQMLVHRDRDLDAVLSDLTTKIERNEREGPRPMTFSLSPEDAKVVEAAVHALASTLNGPLRRGRALAEICAVFSRGGV